jgi:hypothetical protein
VMTNREFEIIDELYFTISFNELFKHLDIEEALLKNELWDLIKKGWVKCMEKITDNEMEDFMRYDIEYKNFNYLATKKGLLAHNSR